jgi:rubredoxin
VEYDILGYALREVNAFAVRSLTRDSRRSRRPSGEDGQGMSVSGQTQAKPEIKRWFCEPCGFIYDPEEGDPDGGIDPGTPFEDIPDDWMCPICGASKADFRELEPGEDFPENRGH